jgi:hypothetical protein
MVMRNQGECEWERPSTTAWHFRRGVSQDVLGLRSFLARIEWHQLSPGSRRDGELVGAVIDLIERGVLVGVYQVGQGRARAGASAERQRAREIERDTRGKLQLGGRSYRLSVDLGLGTERDHYQVVGHDEAKRILDELAGQPGTSAELAGLLRKARDQLSRDWRPPQQPSGLVLLRRVIVQAAPMLDPGPAMTPSQIRKLAEQATLALEVVDLDEKPQEGLAFQIKAPDGNRATGKLDKKGHAQVKSSLPGIFVVTFPELDGADWDGDGALALPPEEDRSEASRHTVKQGERMATIASQYKFLRWQTLWDFAGNADLKDLRQNPNILFPDDEVVIPTKLKREAEVVGGKAKYLVKCGRETLRVGFAVGWDWVERVSYTAKPDTGGPDLTDFLDSDGWMRIDVPPNTSQVQVALWTDDPDTPFATYELKVGELDPVREVTGVQARLASLGYYDGPIDGDAGEMTAAAIAQFRREYGLPLGDQIDDDLRDALEGLHDNDQLPEGSEPDQTFEEDAPADEAGLEPSEEGDTGDEAEGTGDSVDEVQEDDGESDMDALVDEEWDGDWEEESEEDDDDDEDEDADGGDASDGSTQE